MILLLGAPGSGKGTQSKIIIEKCPQYIHISSGDFLREQMTKATDLGKKCMEVGVDKGNYLSDSDMKAHVYPAIINEYPPTTLLDGVIRTIPQAIDFENTGGVIDLVLYLSLSNHNQIINHIDQTRENMIKRLTQRRTCTDCKQSYNLNDPKLMPAVIRQEYACRKIDCDGKIIQRTDDTIENIISKYNNHYLPKTFPLIDHYKNKGILSVIDANQKINEVTHQILSIIR